MVRILAAAGLLLLAGTFPAYAATVDGTLVSIDAEGRTLTLETGAILNLTEYVVVDGLQPGQVVRVTYNDGTVDATAVDILEQAPVEPTDDTTVDGSVTPTGDVTDPTTDSSSDTTTDTVTDQTSDTSTDSTTDPTADTSSQVQ
jgi:hypothetical protein